MTSPLIRNIGGLLVERRRSEAFCSDTSLKNESMRAMEVWSSFKAKSMPERGCSFARTELLLRSSGGERELRDRLPRRFQCRADLGEQFLARVRLRNEAAQPARKHGAEFRLLREAAA